MVFGPQLFERFIEERSNFFLRQFRLNAPRKDTGGVLDGPSQDSCQISDAEALFDEFLADPAVFHEAPLAVSGVKYFTYYL